jgi:cell wall-associated NlpC family hydrolase
MDEPLDQTIERAAVVAEAMTWHRTPYHHHGRVKGVGVDCAMLLAEVFEACGLVSRVEPGAYPVQWHLHRSEERFVGWLAQYAQPLPEGQAPQPGDVALFQFGRCFSHGALLVEPDLALHAYSGRHTREVILTRLDEEPLQGRPVQFWTFWSI